MRTLAPLLLLSSLSLSAASPAPPSPSFRFTSSGLHDPVGSASGLITRLLGPAYLPAFALEVIAADPSSKNDVFELDSNSTHVIIRGNAGYSISAGLNWYLKYSCNSSVTWGRNGSGNNIHLPAPSALPRVAPLRMAANVTLRYAYNVCT
jgi:hypothetical protein